MITLLVLICIVLLVVAIAQLVRIMELSADLKGKTEKDELTTPKDNKSNGVMLFVFFIVFVAFCLWLTIRYWEFLLPEPSSVHGAEIDMMMGVNMVIITIIFLLTNTLLFFFAFRYAGRKDSKALYYPHNNKLEIAWTIAPMVVLAGLITYGLVVWNNIVDMDEKDNQGLVKVEIYAKQFDWTARYPGDDNAFGDADFRLIGGVNALGVDSGDSKAWDDKIVRELHLPVNKPVLLTFRSQDVIHSAYLPHFRVQMNCVPGMTTQFAFTPTKTTAEMRKDEFVVNKYAKINKIREGQDKETAEFDYILLCNKICGPAHYNMQLRVVVETEEEYREWLSKQKTFLPEKSGTKTADAGAGQDNNTNGI